MNQTKSQDN